MRRWSLFTININAFVGVSRPNLVTAEMVSTMKDGIVFAMANPTPEIMPDEAKRGGAAVVGTGRSDFPNQINNVMVFPGIFKGALAVRAREITEGMKIRAARALAALVTDEQLSADYILPSALDKSVADTFLGRGRPRAMRMAGQMMAWKRTISLPTKCTSAGQNFSKSW